MEETITKVRQTVTPDAIKFWLVQRIAEFTRLDPSEIDLETPITRYGLDSSVMLALSCDLEDWLGREIPESTLYDYPTINALVGFFADS